MKARYTAASARGFTLVELVVAMAVLSVALMIASGLLLESMRIFSATGRELREPASELALRLLREDIRAAVPITGSCAPLELHRADRTERWELLGERLVRRGIGPLGENLGARPMLDQVFRFSCAPLGRGLVQIEIVRRKPAGGSALRAPTSAWRSHGETLEAATVVAASRIDLPGE